MTGHKEPLVSIMIPTFNAPFLFIQTLESALAQTYEALEIIVCDNSTDEATAELIRRYLPDKRLRYVRNRGAKTKSANFAPFATLARGEYLQWLMHDDILAPTKVATMAACLDKFPCVKLVTSLRGVIDAQGRPSKEMRPVELPIDGAYQIFDGRSLGKLALYHACNIFGEPSAFMFRRHELAHHYWRAECRGYRVISDVVMCLELLETGDCLIFREPLSFYRRHADQEGQNFDIILQSRLEWVRICQEYRKRGIYLETFEEFRHPLMNFVREYKTDYPSLACKASPSMAAAYENCMKELMAL